MMSLTLLMSFDLHLHYWSLNSSVVGHVAKSLGRLVATDNFVVGCCCCCSFCCSDDHCYCRCYRYCWNAHVHYQTRNRRDCYHYHCCHSMTTTTRDVSRTSWWIVDRVVGAGKRRVRIKPVTSSKTHTHRHRGRITVKSTLFFFFLVAVVDTAFVVHHHFQYQ
jgi:hypothetical protein